MKVCIAFVGRILPINIPAIRNNIETLKQCFDGYDVDAVFVGWSSQDGHYDFCNTNYSQSVYDVDAVARQIDGVIDLAFLPDQPDIESIPKCKNSCHPVFAFIIRETASMLLSRGVEYDFVVMSRHDMIIEIENVEKYMNGAINVPLKYWGANRQEDHHKNDHFSITSFQDFIKISGMTDEDIELISKNSNDNEMFNYHMLRNVRDDIRYIDDEDIKQYIVDPLGRHTIYK